MALDHACLTRTFEPSRAVINIFQGRVRNREKNDVVYVYDRHIELRELREPDKLEFIAASPTFLGLITASAVLKQNFDRDESKGDATRDPIKEVKEEMSTLRLSEPMASLVLLVQQRSEIRIFLSTIEIDTHGQLHFISRSHLLYASLNQTPDARGKCLLAVEPRGRLIAACTALDFFVMFKVRRDDDLDGSSVDRAFVADIDHERYFKVPGKILALEFLFPPTSEVAYLLVVYQNKDHSINRSHYIWEDFDSLQPRGIPNRFQIPREDLLIREGALAGYAMIFGNLAINYPSIDEPHVRPSRIRPYGASRDLPWVAWARPPRRTEWSAENDTFYLARCDGFVLFVESFRLLSGPTFEPTSTENLGIPIENTLAALDYDIRIGSQSAKADSFDLLVTAGNNNQGGLFMSPASEPTRKVQALGVPIPLHSGVVVQRSNLSPNRITSQKLLACRGLNPGQGTLAELRYGIGMDIMWTGDLGIDTSPLDCVSVLPFSTRAGFAAVLCGSGATQIFSCGPGMLAPAAEVVDTAMMFYEASIAANETHLAIAETDSGLLIVVSPSAINVFFPRCEPLRIDMQDRIEKAHIDEANESVSYVSGGTILQMETFVIIDDVITRAKETVRTVLDEGEVTAIYSKKCGDTSYVALSTWTKIMVFEETEPAQFILRYAHFYDIGDRHVGHSLVLCIADTDVIRILLICGTRDGEVHGFELSDEEPRGLRLLQRSFLGSSEVTLIDEKHTSHLQDNNILACCDENLFVMGVRENANQLFFQWESLVAYKTHVSDSDGQQLRNHQVVDVPINAALILAGPEMDNRFRAFSLRILACSNGTLLILEVQNESPGRVHWKQDFLEGIPLAIVDIPDLDVQVLGLAITPPRSGDHNFDRPFDLSLPALKMKGKTGDILAEPHSLSRQHKEHWEKITDMCFWPNPRVVKTDEKSKLIVVSTKRTSRDGAATAGCVYLCGLMSGDRMPTLISILEIPEREPVLSLAPYDGERLVVGLSTHMKIKRLSQETNLVFRLVDETRSIVLLGSPCRQISVVRETVYITTDQHPAVAYQLSNDCVWTKISQLQIAYADPSKRSLGHLVLPEIEACLMTCLPDKLSVCRLPAGFDEPFIPVASAIWPGAVRDMYQIVTQPRPGLANGLPSIVSCGYDGAIYELKFLDYQQFRLLRFIQTLIERNDFLSPHPYRKSKQAQSIHLEPEAQYRTGNLHLDGDTLSRLYHFKDERTPNDILRALLDFPPHPGYLIYDFETVDERKAAFETIVRNCLHVQDGFDLVDAVIGYLERLLASSAFGIASC